MGQYAEMMLDGTCCSCCGEFLDVEPMGFPTLCPGCQEDQNAEERKNVAHTKCGQPRPSKTNCPTCGKLVKKAGIKDHQRDVHGVTTE